jgi:hypothetical protein
VLRLLHRSFFSPLTVRPHQFARVQRRSPSSSHLFFCFRSPALVNTFSRPENIYYDLDGMLRIKQDPLYIEFEIVEAKGLLAADTEKSPPTSDPLVEAYVVFKKSMKKVTSVRPKKVRTKTIKESLSPNWRTKAKGDGSNKFSIDAKGMPSDALALYLKVYDADTLSKECLGVLRLPLKKFFPTNLPKPKLDGEEEADDEEKHEERDKWYDLEYSEDDISSELCPEGESTDLGKIRLVTKIVIRQDDGGKPPLVPRQEQLNKILNLDQAKEEFDTTWCVIEANWINAWLAMVHFNTASPSPGA